MTIFSWMFLLQRRIYIFTLQGDDTVVGAKCPKCCNRSQQMAVMPPPAFLVFQMQDDSLSGQHKVHTAAGENIAESLTAFSAPTPHVIMTQSCFAYSDTHSSLLALAAAQC